MGKKRKKPNKRNLGGLGRPPATWLVHKSLKTDGRITFREISIKTKAPLIAVRRLSEKYASFLKVQHELSEAIALSTMNTERLRLLHEVLSKDFTLRKHLRWYEVGKGHTLRSVFRSFMKAARDAGFTEEDGDDIEEEEDEEVHPKLELSDIASRRAHVLNRLGV